MNLVFKHKKTEVGEKKIKNERRSEGAMNKKNYLSPLINKQRSHCSSYKPKFSDKNLLEEDIQLLKIFAQEKQHLKKKEREKETELVDFRRLENNL